jgi:beta-catenin-like protein 1
MQMGKGNKKSSRLLPSDTEHILGILVSLFTNLASDSAPRIRLLAKFVEGSYEKVDRLLELREDVEGKLGAVEGQIFEERKVRSRSSD